jgi:uncharacterized protein YdhG (YjbR/CyaY superfamily)
MAEQQQAGAIDEYIAGYPAEARAMLERVRAIVREEAPEATETIAYGLPTFDVGRKHLVHFGGFAKHVGFYPTPSGMEEFAEELSRYKTGKGSAQFPIGQPLPEDLVRAIVRFRLGEVRGGRG